MTQIPIGLIAGFILVPTFFICIWVGYVAHAYTEKAEAFLSNSSIVVGTKSIYSQAGLLGKVMRSCILTMALMIKNLCIKKGILELSEVENFPKKLMRLLFVSWGLVFLVCAALMALSIYSNFIE